MNVQRSQITEQDFYFAQDAIRKLADYFSNRVVGQNALKHSLIASIIADGHILIESVPGLAKTTAAKAISDAVDGKFSRIQCTPDLLPSDIIGTQIYHQQTGKFETIFGPVFANFVLLDEVNRSSAKTQSAMLEAMQERQVTIGGNTYRMPEDIFIVIATQNPIEQEGTYPLSEAQTDRFMIKENRKKGSCCPFDQGYRQGTGDRGTGLCGSRCQEIYSRYCECNQRPGTLSAEQRSCKVYPDRSQPPCDHQFPPDRQGIGPHERAHLCVAGRYKADVSSGAAPQDRPQLRGCRGQCTRRTAH